MIYFSRQITIKNALIVKVPTVPTVPILKILTRRGEPKDVVLGS